MDILESAQNYLETIYILKKQLAEVRSIDIANYLCFSKPSVSIAMKQLSLKGFIEISKNGFISLTKQGLEIATEMYERHTLLTSFFVALGVSEKTAVEDACKIEHQLSKETYEKIKEHCIYQLNKK